MDKVWRLLVIDDFAPMRNTIRAGLEQNGMFKVSVLSSANQIWQVLENEQIDILLCDINMPGQSGIELLSALRAHDNYSTMPVVLMTGDGNKQTVSKAIALNVNDFVVKPFTLNQLKERMINVLLRRSRQPAHAPTVAESARSDGQSNGSEIIIDQAAKPSILVVDDEPLNLELVFNLLKDDYRVKVANSGKKALTIVDSLDPPDLLLLDIMMPDMDGYQVCEALMNQSKGDIPVIFLSARTAVADVTKGFALGAVDYIYKPLEPEILKARIRTQLALRDARNQLRSSIDLLMENARLRTEMEHICRHDVKNPLTGVLLHLQLMLDDPNLAAHYKEQLQQILRSTQMSVGMLSQSTDLLQMENGSYRLRPEPVELEPLLLQAEGDLKELIQQKNLQFTYKFFMKNSVVLGEEQLCYFIFSNLLKNAIEAAPARSEIVISVEELQDAVAIRFYNEGVVPPEIRDSLFDKYVSSGKSQGTGLGGYSAKMMTLVQKGDINFKILNESKTVFTVSLPRITNIL